MTPQDTPSPRRSSVMRKVERFIAPRPNTLAASVLCLVVLSAVPQVANIFLQLPVKALGVSWNGFLAGTFILYVVMLLGIYSFGALWLVAPRRTAPLWSKSLPRLEGVRKRLDRVVSWPARLPEDTPPPLQQLPKKTVAVLSVVAVLATAVLAWPHTPPLRRLWPEGDPAPRMLAGLLLVNMLCGLFARGLLTRNQGRTLGWWTEVICRFAKLSLVSYLIGETIWLLVPMVPDFSLRLYSIWAVCHLLFILVALARLMDESRRLFRRLTLGIATALLAVTCMGLLDTESPIAPLHPSLPESTPAQATGDEPPTDAPSENTLIEEWLSAAEARLGEMCEGPAIIVAAAGGGSRAAIFATLALESLAREPLVDSEATDAKCKNGRLSQQVFMLSGVSGGSLASAHFAHRLQLPSPNRYDNLINDLKNAPGQELRAFLSASNCGGSSHAEGNLWPLERLAVDEMLTDFNAPILRGVVLLGVGRGESLAKYWKEAFQWNDQPVSPQVPPLLFLNTANVATGERVIVGKPPLPPALATAPIGPVGRRAQSISDYVPGHDISLADGVRLSANFPWGVDISYVARGSEQRLSLIDGGIYDNTGLDTISLVLNKLNEMATQSASSQSEGTPHARARALLANLRKRRIIVLEIDSGAKPQELAGVARMLRPLFAPGAAMSFASHSYARQMVDLQLDSIRKALSGPEGYAANVVEHRTFLYKPLTGASTPSSPSQCNEEQDLNPIMTAWALGPEDKARLIRIFLEQEKQVIDGLNVFVKNARSEGRPEASARQDPVAVQAWEALTANLQRDRAILATSLGANFFSTELPAVQPFAVETSSMRDSLNAIREDGAAWVLIGQLDTKAGSAAERSQTWRTRYFQLENASEHMNSNMLLNRPLVSLTPVELREGAPAKEGALAKPVGVLSRGKRVIVQEVVDWENQGSIWARVKIDTLHIGGPDDSFQYALFWCEKSGKQGREDAERIRQALLARGVPESRIPIHQLSAATNSRPGYSITGYQVRFNTGEQKVAGDLAGLVKLALNNTAVEQLQVSHRTWDYISIFSCP
ncbi:patatin-like phospholipase family protein [Corallococcus coralloides]|uniref:patatin-like phospholipase family protein n=1 Tax=Corallococcus coralloides TaxID=184914 RepID=UPI00384D1229